MFKVWEHSLCQIFFFKISNHKDCNNILTRKIFV